MEKLVDFLALFKEFFNFPVPLGVCIVVVCGLMYLFSKLQDSRRKDYELSYEYLHKIINSQEEIINNRNDRIRELENQR
ncbi:TPA: hypothetical protein ACGOXG_000089 [Streptococcus suis]